MYVRDFLHRYDAKDAVGSCKQQVSRWMRRQWGDDGSGSEGVGADGGSVRSCLEWTRDFIEALQMRLEVMKIVSS